MPVEPKPTRYRLRRGPDYGPAPNPLAKEVDALIAYWRKRRGQEAMNADDMERVKTLVTILDAAVMLGRPGDLEAVRLAYNAALEISDSDSRKRTARDAVRNAIEKRWGHEPKRTTVKRLLGHLARCDEAFGRLAERTAGQILEGRRPNITAPRIAARLACACGAFGFTEADEEKARVEFAKL